MTKRAKNERKKWANRWTYQPYTRITGCPTSILIRRFETNRYVFPITRNLNPQEVYQVQASKLPKMLVEVYPAVNSGCR